MFRDGEVQRKNDSKLLLACLCLVVAAFCLVFCSLTYAREEMNNVITTNGEFPVTFWWPPPPDKTDLENYTLIADAGFTLILGGNGVINKTVNEKVLEYAQAFNMSVIVRDERIHGLPAYQEDRIPRWLEDRRLEYVVDKVAQDYQGYPSLMGFMLADEPSAVRFPDLAKINELLLERLPDTVPYVNLFPTYATSAQLGTDTYEEYVELYMRTVKPKVLSFDFYPFVAPTWYARDIIRDGFFANLEIIRKKSLEYDTPFWAFVQTCTFSGMRNPSPAEVRWQTYQNLAYGAKGIQYFLYWTLPHGNPETIQHGIVENDGTKTQHYNTVAQLNKELRILGRTLLSLTSEGVYHWRTLPGELDTNYKPDWLEEVSGDNVVIGIFSGQDDAKYMMVVNRSFSRPAAVTLTVNKRYGNVSEISKETGEPVEMETSMENDMVTFKLELTEGDGVLVRLS